MDDLTAALLRLRKGVNFSNIDGTYEGVEWGPDLPDGFVPPTREEVDAEIARLDVPQTVTVSGMIRALDARGMLDAVDAIVDQADDLMKRLWHRSSNFDRHDSMVLTVAGFLGMEDQLDDLFREAKAFSETVQ